MVSLELNMRRNENESTPRQKINSIQKLKIIISEPAPAETRVMTDEFLRTLQIAQNEALRGDNQLNLDLMDKSTQRNQLAISFGQILHRAKALVVQLKLPVWACRASNRLYGIQPQRLTNSPHILSNDQPMSAPVKCL